MRNNKPELTDAERVQRARNIQAEESERKRREASQEPQAQRKVLDDAKRECAHGNDGVLNRVIESAQWTDKNGTRQGVTGPSITYPNPRETPDLLVRSNRRSIGAIHRAYKRIDHALDTLISVWRDNPRALPADLEGHVKKMFADVPSFDSIKMEIVVEPKGNLQKTEV
jgi:hypothetical protein